MASRARFGRLPRSAPSLTSTIVALAQQYQGQRDRNIEDAWKNGGRFEGKAVTDSMFQNHWKDRLKGVSKDDPMWDYYNNLIGNYDFQIAESKMGQKYAEKSVSDGEMARFYRTWAAKLPHDSEAYRNLMTQAAKFRAAASSRAQGGRARAASTGYARSQNSTYTHEEAPYDVITSTLARFAVNAGYMDASRLKDKDYGWSHLVNAEGEDDPTNFAAMLTDLMHNKTVSDAITAQIRVYDPTFSGTFNADTIQTIANNARNGAQTRQNRAAKAGDKGTYTSAGKDVDKYSLSASIIAVATGTKGHDAFIQQNTFYRGQMDAIDDPSSGASPLERQVAHQRYADWLSGQGMKTLYKSFPPGSFDPLSVNYNAVAAGVLGRTNNTLNALHGHATGLTLKDDFLGFSKEKAGPSSDAVTVATSSGGLNATLDAVAKGQAIVVRVSGTGNNAKPDANGHDWAVFDRNAPEVAGASLVPVVGPAHGTYTGSDGRTLGGSAGEVRYEVAVPIKVRQFEYQDPATGAYTSAAGAAGAAPKPGLDTTVGQQVTIIGPGGVPVLIYGVYVNGHLAWTPHNPFRQDMPSTTTTGSNGEIIYNFTNQKPPGPTVKGVPQPTFTPQSLINQELLNSPTTNPNFDVNTSKQGSWDSPLAAFAYSSDPAMKYVEGLGDKAVAESEKQWYSDKSHWTPEMNQRLAGALQSGADYRMAFTGIVTAKSGELVQTIQVNRQNGYGTEQQDLTRAALNQNADQAAAAAAGMEPKQWARFKQQQSDTAARDDLITRLDQWGVANEQQAFLQQAFVQQTAPGSLPSYSPLPKGWSVTDLLTQPGMNIQQANDLAYQITKGAVGTQGPAGVPYVGLAPGLGGVTPQMKQDPYVNPYMPKPGQVGRSANYDPSSIKSYAAPTPKPAPITPIGVDHLIGPVGNVTPQVSAMKVQATKVVTPKKGNVTPMDISRLAPVAKIRGARPS